VIVGGMSLGTLLTIFVVPTMYLLFARSSVPGAIKQELDDHVHPELLDAHGGALATK
jgi:multidrug efflux pump